MSDVEVEVEATEANRCGTVAVLLSANMVASPYTCSFCLVNTLEGRDRLWGQRRANFHQYLAFVFVKRLALYSAVLELDVRLADVVMEAESMAHPLRRRVSNVF